MTPDVQALIAKVVAEMTRVENTYDDVDGIIGRIQSWRVELSALASSCSRVEGKSAERVEGEALIPYVQHKPSCPHHFQVRFKPEPGWVTGSMVKPCTCGLSTLLSGYQEPKK